MARKKVMAGNWKMNNNWAQAAVLAQQISNRYDKKWDEVEVVVCPPVCDLKGVWEVFRFDRCEIGLGAQNVYWEESGAFTGEVSIPMIADIGATHCIVGHSERRGYFGETDADVNRKVRALIDAGLVPIVCVGESLAVRDAETYVEFIENQVSAAFAGREPEQVAKCIVAYEPIWAIGTGRTATPEQAEEVCRAIRAKIAAEYGEGTADAVRIVYGGSMKPANVEGLLAQPDIDGGLIGGASLNAEDFEYLVKACF